jgi:hypothetical protein
MFNARAARRSEVFGNFIGFMGARMKNDSKAFAETNNLKVFISYSRDDMAFVDRLEVALRHHDIESSIDRTEIYAFEDWWKRIETLISQSDAVIFVISPAAVASEICAKEVAFAVSLNKRLAPIVRRAVNVETIPAELSRLNFIFSDERQQFDRSLHLLREALTKDIVWLRSHTEFGQAAASWERSKRASGLLLRSPVLEAAERWLASRPPEAPEPTAITSAFIAESRRGSTRRRNVVTGSLSAALIMALTLAGLGYWQRGIALEQRSLAQTEQARAEEQSNLAIDQRNRALGNYSPLST